VETFILTLRCDDAPGIVQAAATGIANVDGNILENDQFSDPVTRSFSMRTRFESREHVSALEASIGSALQRFKVTMSLRRQSAHRRGIILVSQYDHCLADLLYRVANGDLPLNVTTVVSNHLDCAQLTERYEVPYLFRPVNESNKPHVEAEILELIERDDVDYVILARYMQILSPEFCARLPERIINIHHSFLPGFKGARPYHQAYERGVKLVGATAHFVTADLDEGPIIDQDVVRVSHARRPEDLVAIGRDLERTVLSRAVKLAAEDRVVLAGRRTVIFSQ
jgi:formyltetrahydrofolate deformylase